MKLLFTKSNNIGSKLIRWGLEEPVSHVAVLFFEKQVFHATFSGVKKEDYQEFLKHNEIVYVLDYDLTPKEEATLYKNVYKKHNGNNYDKTAFVYFSIMVLRKKLFGIPLPKTNCWNTSREEICTEIAAEVMNLEKVDSSMMSPYQMYLYLSGQGDINGLSKTSNK